MYKRQVFPFIAIYYYSVFFDNVYTITSPAYTNSYASLHTCFQGTVAWMFWGFVSALQIDTRLCKAIIVKMEIQLLCLPRRYWRWYFMDGGERGVFLIVKYVCASLLWPTREFMCVDFYRSCSLAVVITDAINLWMCTIKKEEWEKTART